MPYIDQFYDKVITVDLFVDIPCVWKVEPFSIISIYNGTIILLLLPLLGTQLYFFTHGCLFLTHTKTVLVKSQCLFTCPTIRCFYTQTHQIWWWWRDLSCKICKYCPLQESMIYLLCINIEVRPFYERTILNTNFDVKVQPKRFSIQFETVFDVITFKMIEIWGFLF